MNEPRPPRAGVLYTNKTLRFFGGSVEIIRDDEYRLKKIVIEGKSFEVSHKILPGRLRHCYNPLDIGDPSWVLISVKLSGTETEIVFRESWHPAYSTWSDVLLKPAERLIIKEAAAIMRIFTSFDERHKGFVHTSAK